MKVFEYMATGKPIVSTTLPGVIEVIDDGDNGLLVEPGNNEGFIAALRRLIADPQLRVSLGDAARRRYVDRHSWQARAQSVLRIYQSQAG
jgi:glycosyltransferase involved in cell wall biosynthesis